MPWPWTFCHGQVLFGAVTSFKALGCQARLVSSVLSSTETHEEETDLLGFAWVLTCDVGGRVDAPLLPGSIAERKVVRRGVIDDED